MKNKKILLISGTSKGLGRDLLKYFVKKNFIIFGCSRSNLKFTSKFYNHSVFDINSEIEIRKWVEKIYKKHKNNKIFFNKIF